MDLETLRHSASHIMAQAVQELFPGTKLAIGPATEEGFYYDFDIPGKTLEPEDLLKIEKQMKKIISSGEKFERQEITKDKAIKFFEGKGEKYKVELLKEIPDAKVSLYSNGKFIDLCRGPHIEKTSQIKAFKLLSIAGAYWRGDEKNAMLQRIYGTAFNTQEELEDHLKRLEEAKKRDHRKLGKELDLFSIHDEAGAGLIYWHPKGATLRMLIEDFLKKEHVKRGYQIVAIPHIAKDTLWRTSGHYDYYKENMYFMEIDEQEYVVKPMNCPGHIIIFKRKTRSYRDLPIRYFELGTVYRYEKSGVLHGLLRVRGFTQDDAHLFVRPDQLQDELINVIDFVNAMMRTFGFEYEAHLSTRPDKFVGTTEIWDQAENALAQAMQNKGIKFNIDKGAGVFYGPKIDIKLKDAIGRLWQGPTIQVDFNLPEKFDLTYIGEDGQKHRPVMIHRVVLGSLERFIGALIEHYAGAFPLWLSPIQLKIVPISDKHNHYAKEIKDELEKLDWRIDLDLRKEKMGYKIREAETQKIPYVIIIGDKEVEQKKISVRSKTKGDLGSFSLKDFIQQTKEELSLPKT